MKRIELKHSALIVIDMQRYFLRKGADAFLDPPLTLIPNVTKLIDAFRAAPHPVVFTRHAHSKGGDLGQMGKWWGGELPFDGDPDSELIEAVSPLRSELLITKTRYSAFERTKLLGYLKKRRVDTVVICGVMTNLCVETTARHAFILDLQPVIVSDACATKNQAYQRASLLNLEYGFAYIAKTKDVVRRLP